MRQVWLSKDEVCELTGWTERHLRRVASDGSVVSRPSTTLYRGQPVKEYALSSLPDDARLKYLDAHQPATVPELPQAALIASPLALPAPAPEQALAPIRVALPAEAEKQAAERLAIIRPLIEYVRDRGTHARFHALALKSGELVTNSDSLAEYIAEQHDKSSATIWRWYSRFQKQGSTALARKPRADKNRSAWAIANSTLADLAALIYIGTPEQPPQSVQVAWEQVCERAARMAVAPPAYETVRSFLRNPNEVSPSMLTYGRMGKKQYEARFAPYMRRGYTEPANSIWVSDHMLHDALCRNDIFGARDGKHIRLQMTTILDYRARYVVGVSWCENGSSHSIKRALLRAFTNYGLPDQFYCDNGKDYRKVARNARPRDFELMADGARACVAEASTLSTSLMQRLGIPVTFCLPYHPQSKHIERYHRTVHERFDKSFITYTAGATHLRPDAATAALAQHGKLLQMGRAAESQLPLASEFMQMCEAWIESWYHQRPQPDSEGMDGRSPAEVFAAERRMPERPCPAAAELATLLCERAVRKVSNCAVEIAGMRLAPDAGDHLANFHMHERNGRRVTVAYDPLDPLFAAVLDDDLHYVCRLQAEELMAFSQDDDTQARIQSFISNRNGLRKAVRESTADLNGRVRIAGYTSLEEQQRQRLQLPRAVGDVSELAVQQVQRPQPDSTYKQTHSEDNVDRFFQRLGDAR